MIKNISKIAVILLPSGYLWSIEQSSQLNEMTRRGLSFLKKKLHETSIIC